MGRQKLLVGQQELGGFTPPRDQSNQSASCKGELLFGRVMLETLLLNGQTIAINFGRTERSIPGLTDRAGINAATRSNASIVEASRCPRLRTENHLA
jgi:hypothetical protein